MSSARHKIAAPKSASQVKSEDVRELFSDDEIEFLEFIGEILGEEHLESLHKTEELEK